ncbi:MAG: class I SAM-dependent methyltransferase [Nitrospinota bacterium]
MKPVRWLYSKISGKPFPDLIVELKKAVAGCETLLDVGCGTCSPIESFSKKIFCVGLDIHQPSVEKSKAKNIHNEYRILDVMEIERHFKPASFECVLALEIIEHMEKEDGRKLLEMAERIAEKRVVIYTPNGFLKQDEYDDNPWQVHKSGWTVKDMQERGYRVVGINGWKPLRKEHSVTIRPKDFWLVISDITQIFLRNKPEKAFQILCIKDINRSG